MTPEGGNLQDSTKTLTQVNMGSSINVSFTESGAHNWAQHLPRKMQGSPLLSLQSKVNINSKINPLTLLIHNNGLTE